MEDYTSFDRLVSGITNDERINLLKKLESNSDPEKQNIEKKEIIKKIAKDRGKSKNEIYQYFLNK
mgnify:CR=1 FL=1